MSSGSDQLPAGREPATSVAKNPLDALEQGQDDGDSLWLMVFLNLLLVLLAVFIMILSFQEFEKKEERKEDPDLLRKLEEAKRSKELKEKLSKLRLGAVDMYKGRPRIVLASGVVFATASADLTPEARRRLTMLAQVLRPQESQLMIEGHTDNRPIRTAKFPSNWELSVARALAVLRYLMERGIAPDRMKFVGYGQHRPRAPNETEEGRRLNRRIEMKVR